MNGNAFNIALDSNGRLLFIPNTTSATTYKLRAGGYNSRAFRINEMIFNDPENNTATSTLTLIEIAV